jgi:hypothetical protein
LFRFLFHSTLQGPKKGAARNNQLLSHGQQGQNAGAERHTIKSKDNCSSSNKGEAGTTRTAELLLGPHEDGPDHITCRDPGNGKADKERRHEETTNPSGAVLRTTKDDETAQGNSAGAVSGLQHRRHQNHATPHKTRRRHHRKPNGLHASNSTKAPTSQSQGPPRATDIAPPTTGPRERGSEHCVTTNTTMDFSMLLLTTTPF